MSAIAGGWSPWSPFLHSQLVGDNKRDFEGIESRSCASLGSSSIHPRQILDVLIKDTYLIRSDSSDCRSIDSFESGPLALP